MPRPAVPADSVRTRRGTYLQIHHARHIAPSEENLQGQISVMCDVCVCVRARASIHARIIHTYMCVCVCLRVCLGLHIRMPTYVHANYHDTCIHTYIHA